MSPDAHKTPVFAPEKMEINGFTLDKQDTIVEERQKTDTDKLSFELVDMKDMEIRADKVNDTDQSSYKRKPVSLGSKVKKRPKSNVTNVRKKP